MRTAQQRLNRRPDLPQGPKLGHSPEKTTEFGIATGTRCTVGSVHVGGWRFFDARVSPYGFAAKATQRLAIYCWPRFQPRYNLTMMKCAVQFRLMKMCLSLAVPPPVGTRWIHCRGHRYLATMTNDAKWKCFESDEILSIATRTNACED